MKWHQRITELGVTLSRTDYASPADVNEHNAAADKLRGIVLQAASASDIELNELLSFLSDPNLRGWIAFALAGLSQVPPAQREHCISVIRELAEGEGPEPMAAQW